MSLPNLRVTSERGAASTTITRGCLDIIGEVRTTGEIWIDHLTFRNCGPRTSDIEDGWGVYVNTWAGVAVRIHDNVFVGNDGRGAIGLGSSTVGVHFAAAVARNYVLDNHGEEGALDIDLPADFGEDYCLRVENNVVTRNRAGIVLGYHPFSTNALARFEFVNNTIARNRAGLGLPGPAAPSKWFNNIFFGNEIDFAEDAELESVYDFRNNLVESGVLTGQKGNFTADPRFRGADDFHLQAASPAAAAGTEHGAPLEDMDGVARAVPPDIGAYAVSSVGGSEPSLHCGDGIVQRGEVQGPGGALIGYEACDDGNTQDGDGCSSHCQFEPASPRHEISEQSGSLCAVRSDHTLSCWGLAAANAPKGFFKNVALSEYLFCALDMGGAVACWRDTVRGSGFAPAGSYRQITSDYNRICGLRMDGAIDCWDSSTSRRYPGDFIEVSVNGRVCGLDAAGQPTCFDPYAAKLPAGPFVQFIPTPNSDFCALDRNGKLSCSNMGDIEPAAKRFYGGLVSLDSDRGFACGIRPDGRGVCWSDFSTTQPPQDRVFVEVTAGFGAGCGLMPDHRVHCWGDRAGYPRE
jgi:cysteine-rich repeat protein